MRNSVSVSYRESEWFRRVVGDQYVGACMVCGSGVGRFWVNFRGRYCDSFGCRRCEGMDNREFARLVYRGLGIGRRVVRRSGHGIRRRGVGREVGCEVVGSERIRSNLAALKRSRVDVLDRREFVVCGWCWRGGEFRLVGCVDGEWGYVGDGGEFVLDAAVGVEWG